jgi:pimeloyl-ACP methyl ester carboxylesterase
MNLNYKEYGSGEPVLILHGLFGTLDNWQLIAKWLSTDHTVFILDLPNHGRSPHTEGVIDYPMMAEVVAAFMVEHWLYEVNLVGHSMGGKVAMQIAMSYPDMVSKLAVIDIAPKTYKGGHEGIFDALLKMDIENLRDRKTAEAYLMEKLEHDAGTVQFLMKNLSRKTNDDMPNQAAKEQNQISGYEWKMNLKDLHLHYPTLMGDIVGHDIFSKPTLFIGGSQSHYIEHTDMTKARLRFPFAELLMIEGAGHWVHADKPKELYAALKSFFNSIENQ